MSPSQAREDSDVAPTAQRAGQLERARGSYGARAWLDAYEAFLRADEVSPLGAEDLELLATAAYMLGRDDEYLSALERAHHAYVEVGDSRRAVRCACWIGVNLSLRGEMGPASGWFSRAQRMVERQEEESGERGFLLIPRVFQHEAAGDLPAAAAVAGEAAAIAERFGDTEGFALATYTQGHMLIQAGRVADGLALLDEAMVALASRELSPIATGIVYCGVILACQEVFEVRRAQEWTAALTRWCREQPDLVAFTGRCLLHRAELKGAWQDALEEARKASARFSLQGNPAAGVASYRQAELLRLQGEFAAAEEAYRDASRHGWEPQPGMAQLRLAQGNLDTAVAAIRRAISETRAPLKRAALLPAHVEIELASGDVAKARAACQELEDLAKAFDSTMLSALAAHSRGAIHLAEGDARGALVPLKKAVRLWQELEAPYETARARALTGSAYRALGDDEAAELELEAASGSFRQLGADPDLARLDSQTTSSLDETHGLTPRELEVLRLVSSGKSNREIAAELVISEHTVTRHVQNIFAKLGVSSRSAATAFAFEHDLV
jgi:DNA-binding CsgD family transcriptional regulator/tetratricopeptide (TPR) repeat protein